MFSDSEMAKHFSMARLKASYIIHDGIGPLFENDLCRSLSKEKGCIYSDV